MENASLNIFDWQKGSENFVLNDDSLFIWQIHLPSVPLRKVAAFLSDDENLKASKYRFAKDQICYRVCRGLLRILLGNYLSAAPSEIKFYYNQYGKPFVEKVGENSVFFNLSHSNEYALMAFSRRVEMGIDIEYMRTVNFIELAEYFFSAPELLELNSVAEPLRMKAFYNCWTRKEAFIKAIGKGLSFPLKDFYVSLNPAHQPTSRILNYLSNEEDQHIYNISTHPEYCAALALKSNTLKIRAFTY